MNKLHHPSNRYERLRIKKMKDTFDSKSKRSPVKHRRAEIEEKELDDAIRIEVSGTEEESFSSGNQV